MRTHLLSRRLAGGLVALTAALGLAVALSGESPAQNPPKKEEQEEPAKPKVKPPPAVEDEEPTKPKVKPPPSSMTTRHRRKSRASPREETARAAQDGLRPEQAAAAATHRPPASPPPCARRATRTDRVLPLGAGAHENLIVKRGENDIRTHYVEP